MRIMLTGCNGQVGWELKRSLSVLGQVVACDRKSADLSMPDTLRTLVATIRPHVIVNAAAYTMVDKAEEDEALATMINAEAVGVLADEARAAGALFVHYSTDYVFDGAKKGAYVETDPTNPLGAYGRGKLAGERAVQEVDGDWLMFRTSWVYAARGQNFLLTVLRLAADCEILKIVADQFGAPTSARTIADATAQAISRAIEERRSGGFVSDLFHLTASGMTSWYGFASEIVEAARATLPPGSIAVHTVVPMPTSDHLTPGRRPANSVLDNAKLKQRFGISLSSWQDAMALVLDDLFEGRRCIG